MVINHGYLNTRPSGLVLGVWGIFIPKVHGTPSMHRVRRKGDPIGDGIINGKNHEKHPPIFLLHMAIGKELVGQK